MNDKLKPCPFCGSENLDEGRDTMDSTVHFHVYCLDCQGAGPEGDTSGIAEGNWNRRAAPRLAQCIHMLRPGIKSAAWGVVDPFICGERHVPGGTTAGDSWVDNDWRLVTCPCCLAEEEIAIRGLPEGRIWVGGGA